jgi:hypothetical protein
MDVEDQGDMLSDLGELHVVQMLLADLHQDLTGRVARFRQLADLSSAIGSHGTMITGGEVSYMAWAEARSSYVHGNFVATVLLCQAMAEHVLASYLDMMLDTDALPPRIAFRETLRRCEAKGIISAVDARDFQRMANLRNPLSHHRLVNDPTNLTRRVLNEQIDGEEHLRRDATFAIGMAVRLLALPSFRLGGRR